MVDMHLPLNSGYNSRTQNLLRVMCRLQSATTIVRKGLEEVSTCIVCVRARGQEMHSQETQPEVRGANFHFCDVSPILKKLYLSFLRICVLGYFDSNRQC
jgi:hypothetical protein